MPRTQPAANAPRLPIDIASLVAAEEEGDASDLVGDPAPERRVQLPDVPNRPPRPCLLVHRRRHSCLDQPWADGVASDVGAGELITCRLHEGDDGRFGGGVVGCREGRLVEREVDR